MRKIVKVKWFEIGDRIWVVWTTWMIETCVVQDVMVEAFMIFKWQTISIVFTDEDGKQRLMKIFDEKIFTDEAKAMEYSKKMTIKDIRAKIILNYEQARGYTQSARELKEDLSDLLKK